MGNNTREWAVRLLDARLSRGWRPADVLRQLRLAARAAGREDELAAPEHLRRYLRDWEHGRHRPDVFNTWLLRQVYGHGGNWPFQDMGAADTSLLADRPTHVARSDGAGYVDHVRDTVRHLVALDNEHGGDGVAEVAARAFRAASLCLAGPVADGLRRDLQAAVAELAEVAGWVAYDADQPDAARTFTLESLHLARLAGDRRMELFGFANLAMIDTFSRRPGEALGIAEHVLNSDLSPRLAALFHIRRGRALAQIGDRSRAYTALRQAAVLLDDGVSDADPPWTWWIDEHELRWHLGMAHADLAEWTTAVDQFATVVEGLTPVADWSRARRRYNDSAHLAHALTTVDAWADLAPVLDDLAAQSANVGSARTVRLLRPVLVHIEQDGPDSVGDAAHSLRVALTAA